MSLPKIYVFCGNEGCDGRGDWHVGHALAEDGTRLAEHVSSNHSFMRAHLGNRRLGYDGFDRDKEYNAKYPDGYEVVWLEGAALDEFVRTLKAIKEAAVQP